jgi:SsrA-binding protein
MLLLKNKKAQADYEILDKYRAGISLFGHEVKSLKAQQGSFADSFVTIRNGEAFLKSFYIPPYQSKNTPEGYDKYRERKLLLNKKELKILEKKVKEKRLTLIPLEFELVEKGRIKLIFALASGLKKHDKREKLKERDIKRRIDRTIKNFNL